MFWALALRQRGLFDEGPMLETLDYTIRIGSTPTFLYFDLLLLTDYKKERWRIRNAESWLSGTSMILKQSLVVWLANIVSAASVFLKKDSVFLTLPTLSARFETTVLISSNFVVINVRIAHFYSNFSTLGADIIHMKTVPSIPRCVRFYTKLFGIIYQRNQLEHPS